jgi:parvulin-like peptidyl-prolyl isomerase
MSIDARGSTAKRYYSKRDAMKKITLISMLAFIGLSVAGAQTTIDKPAATIKLTRMEVISVRQLQSDVDKLEKTTGTKFDAAKINQVLDARINSMLFLQYCDKEKIFVSDAEVNNALASMKANLGQNATDADLAASLRANGVFVDPMVYVKQRLLFQTYAQTHKAAELKAAMIPPTADEILKAYDLAKASLVRPDTERVSVLYIDTRGKSDVDIKKAHDLITSMSTTLKSNPSKFDEYVLRSGDSAGYKAISSMYVEKTSQSLSVYGQDFFDAVFRLKPNDISPVIESPTGLRIVRANEFLPQKQLSLTDTVPGNPNATVQDFLSYQLSVEKEQKFMDKLESDLIVQLRKDATIKVFTENLNF